MNTLFLGNGFSMSVAPEIPAWKSLLKSETSKIKNYPILYEQNFIQNADKTEESIKKELTSSIEQNIKNAISQKESIASWFRDFLIKNKIDNIITTNYDHGIEYILKKCGYKNDKNNSSEKIYSIRRYKKFIDSKKKEIILWKIHGDIDVIKSITLGFDQYCGSLSKLNTYIKGEYKSSQNSHIGQKSIQEKCKDRKLRDYGSWAELFFFSNIYILGFGMDFAEIDIWWLLNKRARIKLESPELIKNKIIHYSNPHFDKNKEDIFESLNVFGVTHRQINTGTTLLEFMKNDFKL